MRKEYIKKQTEKALQEEIINATNRRKDARLFRNNVGMCTDKTIGLRFGLRKGSSDLIGFKTVKITKNMIGKKIAVFMAIECKIKNRKPTNEQKIFINNVRKFGGIGIVVRSINDLLRVIGEENASNK